MTPTITPGQEVRRRRSCGARLIARDPEDLFITEGVAVGARKMHCIAIIADPKAQTYA